MLMPELLTLLDLAICGQAADVDVPVDVDVAVDVDFYYAVTVSVSEAFRVINWCMNSCPR